MITADEEFVLSLAEQVYDGWFADNTRIDWHEFIDRLETYSDVDFGMDMDSTLIRSVKSHIRRL
jgi:hypothetical protein